MNQRTVKFLKIALASAPLWVLADLYSLALRARLALGRWPRPYHPDPKDLLFDFQYMRVAFTLRVGVPALLVLSAALLIWIMRSGGKIASTVAMMCCTWGLAVAARYLDPGNLFKWFWD